MLSRPRPPTCRQVGEGGARLTRNNRGVYYVFRADGLGSNTRLVVDYKYGPMMQPDLLILSGGRATERPARPRMAGLQKNGRARKAESWE